MLPLTYQQISSLKNWFLPDRPGPLIGLHVINTGHGHGWADRWPNPRAVLVETAGNYALAGQPEALSPAEVQAHLRGFIEAPASFIPLLAAACPELKVWDRIMLELPGQPHVSPQDQRIRRLDAADSASLNQLSLDTDWISKTWGGPTGLAASGLAWAAFIKERLVSLACPFFVGERYEDIGVVTEAAYRGLGLSAACAAAVCQDILARGRRPSWTTSPDNRASLRVAEKLGFTFQRHDCLYLIGIVTPEPVERPSD